MMIIGFHGIFNHPPVIGMGFSFSFFFDVFYFHWAILFSPVVFFYIFINTLIDVSISNDFAMAYDGT